mmetsp:Transcript_9824/g.22995  ORF Transcript_9824/g.22995 Transcript_9824/m.22995 type:complete len:300 (-) Transcript_9824:85-984(-)
MAAPAPPSESPSGSPPATVVLEAVGFCGADDTVNVRHLLSISGEFPLVEWGVLLRPGREGLPRYATERWIGRLAAAVAASGRTVRLAAHLCGTHVDDLLSSHVDESARLAADGLLARLAGWGFRRVQVNPTAVNGVDVGRLGEASARLSLLRTVRNHPSLEFIVQRNGETEALWGALLADEGEEKGSMSLPENVVFLHDESKGTGKESSSMCAGSEFVRTARRVVGYAGGIRPGNVVRMATLATEACAESGGRTCWIDMESGVRSRRMEGDAVEDVFDLSKCYDCVDALCEAGLVERGA